MLALTFAPEEQVRAVIARIDGIHVRIRGTCATPRFTFRPARPTRHRIPSPLWVHATLIESNLLTY